MKRYIRALPLTLVCAIASVHGQTLTPIQTEEGYIIASDKGWIFYKIVGSGSETLVAVHGGPGNSLESIRADLAPLANGR